MDDELELADVSEEDHRPPTRADLDALARRLEAAFVSANTLTGLERRVAATVATKQELADFKDEIIRHFEVVAENIHRDVAGANADEIYLIQDRQAEHEQRVAALE